MSCNNVAVAQLKECLTGVPKDFGLTPVKENFFPSTSFKEEVRQMEKNIVIPRPMAADKKNLGYYP